MNKNNFSKINEKLMNSAMNDPKYRGFHVVVVGGKIFKSKSGQGVNQILKKNDTQYPNDIPEIAYFPKVDSLIL